jgi:hypothetical protein
MEIDSMIEVREAAYFIAECSSGCTFLHAPPVRAEGRHFTANVFISHTGADAEWAEEICRWLLDDDHNVFLDVDKRDGVSPGDDWEPLLYERLRWADAVVCVVTPSYLQSAAEIGAARALGSELLPVCVTSEPLDDHLLRLKQYVAPQMVRMLEIVCGRA